MSIVSVDNIQPIGSGTSVTVNSAATLVLNNANSTGVITATSFVGGLPITNGADNRVITASSASALNGESQLLFTGTNLGVGDRTTSPNERLHVHTSSGQANIHVEGATDGQIILRSHNGDSVIHFGDASATSVGKILYDHGTDSLQFNTNSNPRLHIDSTGKIGISESSPSNQLHVSGTTGTSAGGLLRLDATTGDNFILFDNTNDNTEWAVGYDSTTRGKFDIWYDDNSSGYDLKFSVDGATGAVRKPKNPVFIAYRVNSYNTTTSAAVLVYDSEQMDVGGNYNPSNGRFTAPVTGLYEFAYAAIAANTQTVYRYDLRVNGALPYSPLILELRIDQNNQTAYGTNGEYVCYVNMTAGQYAQVYVHSDSAVNNVYGSSSYGYTYFRGRLIG